MSVTNTEAPQCEVCGCRQFAHMVNGKTYTNHSVYVYGAERIPAVTTWEQYKASVREAYGSLRGVTFTIA